MLILLIIVSFIFYNIEKFKGFQKPTGYHKKYKCTDILESNNNKNNNDSYTLKSIKTSKSTKGFPLLEIEDNTFQNLLNTLIDKELPNKNVFSKLESSKYDYYLVKKKITINNIQISHISRFIINKINHLLLGKGYTSGLNNGFFTILSYHLVNIFKNNRNGDIKYTINMVIYRINKKIPYQIQTTILVINKVYKIEQLEVIGNLTTDKLGSIHANDEIHIDIFSKINNDIIVTNKSNDSSEEYQSTKEVTNQVKKNNKELLDIKKYKCFVNDDSTLTRNICQNDRNIDGNKFTKRGIWDKNCENDSECPFYQANKNYPNNYGGCINNKCQLPINMISISPHFYDYKHHNKPYCYNCKNGNYMCCDEQMDKKKYPLLKSPDYAFPNDYKLRYKYKNFLKKNGLTYSKVYN